jgi:hypothetical protein
MGELITIAKTTKHTGRTRYLITSLVRLFSIWTTSPAAKADRHISIHHDVVIGSYHIAEQDTLGWGAACRCRYCSNKARFSFRSGFSRRALSDLAQWLTMDEERECIP